MRSVSDRLYLSAMRRIERIDRVSQEPGPNCTFHPTITKKAQRARSPVGVLNASYALS